MLIDPHRRNQTKERRMVAAVGLEPTCPEVLVLEASAYANSAKRPDWSWRRDLNPQPADYKSAALPIELRQHKSFFGQGERYKPFAPILGFLLTLRVAYR